MLTQKLSENPISDIAQAFQVGESVKAKLLRIDSSNRRLAFSFKTQQADNPAIEDAISDTADLPIHSDSDSSMQALDEDDIILTDADDEVDEEFPNFDEDDDEEEEATDDLLPKTEPEPPTAMPVSVGKIDFSGNVEGLFDEDLGQTVNGKNIRPKRRKPLSTVDGIQIDRTATLAESAPENETDYERHLLGSPDSSALWVQYMAFYLELGNTEKAREIAERALTTINYRAEGEKFNIWSALLNLEVVFGSDETQSAVFKRACQYLDAKKAHQQLCNSFALNNMPEKAKTAYRNMVKTFSQDPEVWLAYATYLMEQDAIDDARDLLSESLNSILPKNRKLYIFLSAAGRNPFFSLQISRPFAAFHNSSSSLVNPNEVVLSWKVF